MKRKWPRRLAIAAGALVLVVVSAVLAWKYWLVPFILRQQIAAALRERWDGQLTLLAINVNWTGPSYLRRVELSDATGREWLRAETVKLTLRNWPGLHPVLSEVEIEDLDLQGHFSGGALQLPIKPAPFRQGKNKYVDLRVITVRNMSIGGVAEGNAKASCGGLQLTVRRDGHGYRIEMERIPNAPGERLRVSGTVKGDLDTDLNVSLKHTFSENETAALLTLLNAPFVTRANGTVDVNVDLRGRLADLPSASAIGISGGIALSEGSVFCALGPLCGNLNVEVQFDGQRPPRAIARGSARFCQGQTEGDFAANVQDDGTLEYRCRVDAQGVDFDEMLKLLGVSQEAHKGELQSICVLEGHTGAPGETTGRGYLYLTDAHLGDVPLLASLFNLLEISPLDALQSTDVEATFSIKGLLVTVNKARVANAIAAIDIEPGGQVDIEKHNLDLYAIVAPIKMLHDLFARVPLVELVVKLQDRLARVRIHGDWNAEPASLISKEPLKDIGQGTVDFLNGVVSSGGRLGKSLYSEFDERFVP